MSNLAAPDLDLIKDVPGYKLILKAVLKSQIQELVEQLAAHTDEQSVLLTVNVIDGTLSHLGSDLGQRFLKTHKDFKPQYLSFCLNTYLQEQPEDVKKGHMQILESMNKMQKSSEKLQSSIKKEKSSSDKEESSSEKEQMSGSESSDKEKEQDSEQKNISAEVEYGPASKRKRKLSGGGIKSEGARRQLESQMQSERNSTDTLQTSVKTEPNDASNDAATQQLESQVQSDKSSTDCSAQTSVKTETNGTSDDGVSESRNGNQSAVPDLEVIKDIPGYKVILKAIIKSQMQKMVEHLAAHTDEESLILIAHVIDGTLSHLGSDFGKGFLETHEDVKPQFLSYCLNKYHHKQREVKKLERLQILESMQQNLMQIPARGDYAATLEEQRRQRMLESLKQMSAQLGYGPASKRFRSAGAVIRSSIARHKPYTQMKSRKQEPSDASSDGFNESNNVNQYASRSALSEDDDDDVSNMSFSSSSTIPNEPGKLSLSACETDNGLNESDMSGRLITSSDFDVSMEIKFDPDGKQTKKDRGSGAKRKRPKRKTEQPALKSASTPIASFRKKSDKNQRIFCEVCDKDFANKQNLRRHRLIHTGEKRHECILCGMRFTQKVTLRRHIHLVHKDIYPGLDGYKEPVVKKEAVADVEKPAPVNSNEHKVPIKQEPTDSDMS